MKLRGASRRAGTARPPARCRAVGFSDEDSAADHRRRQHLDRDDALQLQPARRWPSSVKAGHPRGRRHADGVQHHRHQRRHHDGHRGHEGLARQPRGHRRLDRARRARPHVRRASSCSPAATRRSRRGDGARAPRTCPASCSTAARSCPARFDGRDVTIQDVFEAVGAHAAGPDRPTPTSTSSSDVACPGAGACGGQFTANTMAMALRVPRASRRSAAAACRPIDPRKDERRRVACGQLVMDVARSAALRPQRHPHARGVRERASPPSPRPAARPTPCCTCWRSRARPASPLDDRRLRPHQRAHAADRRPEAGRPLHRRRPAPRRRHRARRASACSRPGCSTATRAPSPAARSPRKRAGAAETPGAGGRAAGSTGR